jgi:phosphoglycolate phosphatase
MSEEIIANPLGIKLAVFDLDGTLVDAFEDIAAAVNYMLARGGLPPRTVEEVKRHVGKGVRMLVKGILATDDEALVDEKVRVLTDYYTEHPIRTARLYKGVPEALRKLRQAGIKLAVASNKPHPLTYFILDALAVAPYLNWIIGASEKFPRKPAPDILFHLMKESLATPQQTIVVGDSSTDVEFARAAGVPVVCVSYGQCTREELESFAPDAIVDSMPEFVSRLTEGSLFEKK